MDFIHNLIANFSITDAIDIAIIAFIIYSIIIFIKGTKAVYVIIGLFIGLIALWASSIQGYELFVVNRIFRVFFSNLPLIIVVLFQSEIRKALAKIGKRPFFSKKTVYTQGMALEEVIKATVALANRKIGALIVIERDADISDYLDTGVRIDAEIDKDLIISIFLPISPLHDGALSIQNDRISKVGCFLPLTLDPRFGQIYGTRHRAGIGLTEEIDAVVIVVSEERGTISVAVGGKITRDLDAIALRKVLQNLLLNKQILIRAKKKSEKDIFTKN